jgi:hypothetical protein
MHRVNLLNDVHKVRTITSCDRRNHLDCVHPLAFDHGMAVDLAPLTWADGWSMFVQITNDAVARHDMTGVNLVIEELEQRGCNDEFDCGLRDAMLAAFGQ